MMSEKKLTTLKLQVWLTDDQLNELASALGVNGLNGLMDSLEIDLAGAKRKNLLHDYALNTWWEDHRK